MKPIEFDGSNAVYAKHQPEYVPLPAHRTSDGKVTSCWQLDWKERLKCLFNGKVFITVLTFNNPLQPMRLDFDKPQLSRGE